MFRLYADENSYHMEIRLDRENIEKAMNKDCVEGAFDLSRSEKLAQLEDYLHTNFQMKLNGASTDYEVLSFSNEKGYLVAHTVFDIQVEQKIAKIEVINTCLLDIVDGHDNIILVQLNDRVRSFRLNKKLQSTTIKY